MGLRKVTLAMASMFVVATSGCGVIGSVFGSDDDDGNNATENGGAGAGGGFSGGAGNSNSLGDLQACATSSARGSLQQVNLIVMFDKSGSMGQYKDQTGEYDNTAQRWTPVSQGMTTFFSDPQSEGLNAALQFFPPRGQNECTASGYRNPAVALTPLPSSDFGDAISRITPEGGTPTSGALLGAFGIAKNTLASRSDERAVVVLVTDGQPTACSDLSGVYETARAGFAGKPSIATYVVGVGPDVGNLDEIARNGGTTKATYVGENSDPTETSNDLVTQLNKIRGEVMSCSFAIPTPSDGKELDIHAVNVVLTPTGGKATTLTYNSVCTGGQGWHYDDASAPKAIQLCESSCNSIKQDKGAQIAIAFGCATNGKIN